MLLLCGLSSYLLNLCWWHCVDGTVNISCQSEGWLVVNAFLLFVLFYCWWPFLPTCRSSIFPSTGRHPSLKLAWAKTRRGRQSHWTWSRKHGRGKNKFPMSSDFHRLSSVIIPQSHIWVEVSHTYRHTYLPTYLSHYQDCRNQCIDDQFH